MNGKKFKGKADDLTWSKAMSSAQEHQLLVCYFLLGGSEANLELLPIPKDVDKRFESTITDAEQRKEIQKIVDEAAKEMNKINERLLKINQKGQNLNLN